MSQGILRFTKNENNLKKKKNNLSIYHCWCLQTAIRLQNVTDFGKDSIEQQNQLGESVISTFENQESFKNAHV